MDSDLQLKYEVFNKPLKRVVFQAPERKHCREWVGNNGVDPDLKIRKIK
jgi:hypothetical protein